MTDREDNRGLPTGRVTLYVTATERGIDASLRQMLRQQGYRISEPYPQVMTVACDANQLRQVCRLLSTHQRERILFHVGPPGEEPSAAQLMQSSTLQQLCNRLDSEWIQRVVRDRQLVTYFQPIVSNHVPASIYAYECLLRGVTEEGRLIPPLQLISAARDTGLLPDLDQAAQLLAIQSATQHAVRVCVFINFSPRLLEASTDWIDQTIRATIHSGIAPGQFVFEVVESDQIADLSRLLVILDSFRDAGCRVALDDVGAGYNSLNLLTLVKPDFVKLDMELIRGVHLDPYKSCVARKLLELARELGVLTIAEGVETQEEWTWTREHGADLAQGYLFARPAPQPPPLDVVCPEWDRLDEDSLQRDEDTVPLAAVGCGRSIEP